MVSQITYKYARKVQMDGEVKFLQGFYTLRLLYSNPITRGFGKKGMIFIVTVHHLIIRATSESVK